ncbi:MAG: (Fe-S)-binding protein [Chloroflexi bacterium]|nr:(Fe-S)-binding protein [Chloroflexota bacterium]
MNSKHTDTTESIIKNRRAYYCLDCGKCTGICPITRHDPGFSPRRMVEMITAGSADELLQSRLLWLCLTCRQCSQVCPSDVHYSEFIRDLRAEARHLGCQGECTHGDVIHTWMRIMADPTRHQNRLEWLDDDLRVSEQSDTVYWVGCLPHYDIIFGDQGFQPTEIARSTIRVLNHLGIEPMVLADERCCGHDLLWEGDTETFRQLAEINLSLLEEAKSAGARRIVTACPECARTLGVDYPGMVGSTGLEVIHISQLLAESDLPPLSGEQRRVTYQDPCRLGRYLGVYDAPRAVIEALGLELVEMAHNRHSALCCGTSCWTACGATNKALQENRLREARATGADLLVTSCAKCQIHFRCAMADGSSGDGSSADEAQIEIKDLVTLVAEALRPEGQE